MNKIFEYGKAICYSGYRAGQSPVTVCPTREQIEEDLEILNNEGYKYLRMYDPNDHARTVLQIIRDKKLPFKCLIGIDNFSEISNPESCAGPQNFSEEELRSNAARNDAELEKLIELVKEFDEEVIAVSIGNENTPSWGTRILSEERLIHHIDRLHEALDKPVTFCEGGPEWPVLTELGNKLDFISVHSYPMHGGVLIDDAVELNKTHYEMAKKQFPDKEIIFTEVGWTIKESAHMVPGQGSIENQKRYITELYDWIDKEEIVSFIFEAFDEPWKGDSPEKGECNWGLFYVDRTKKW